MGYLTTHILDTTQGLPAADVAIVLYEYQEGHKVEIGRTHTNEDGRCDPPLLNEEAFHQGIFEIEFAIGNYFRKQNQTSEEPLFLDDVVIRFGINDATSHYHVPLLISPYGYSTYRGS